MPEWPIEIVTEMTAVKNRALPENPICKQNETPVFMNLLGLDQNRRGFHWRPVYFRGSRADGASCLDKERNRRVAAIQSGTGCFGTMEGLDG